MDKVLIWLYSRVSQIFQDLKEIGSSYYPHYFFGNLDALTLYFGYCCYIITLYNFDNLIWNIWLTLMQLGLIFTQTSKFMYDTLEGQEERKESVLKSSKKRKKCTTPK